MVFHELPSYILILLLLVPALVYSLMPLRDFYKYPLRRTVAISAAALAALIMALALPASALHIVFKLTLTIGLIPVLALHMTLTQGKIRRRLFCFFNSTMIIGNSLVYGCVLAAPFETDGSFITMRPITCLTCLAVSAILGVIYYSTLRERIPYLISSESLNMNYRLALAVTIFITTLFFWVSPKYATVVMAGRVRVTILTFLLLAPGAFYLLYHSMWRVAVNLTENAKLRESNELMAMEQKRYEELRSYMDETRNLRHDFRQHLLVMDGYAKNGETEKLADYIEQFSKSLSEHRSLIAANPALDAVASHYDNLANSQGIHIKWLIELPAELPVKESDFITIFGNLVENAIHAVEGMPEEDRYIHVNAKILSDAMLGITVKNPYKGEIKLKKDGLPRSDKAGHGIGLTSVKTAISRYNGVLDINTEDNMFSVGVLIYTQ